MNSITLFNQFKRNVDIMNEHGYKVDIKCYPLGDCDLHIVDSEGKIVVVPKR